MRTIGNAKPVVRADYYERLRQARFLVVGTFAACSRLPLMVVWHDKETT